MAEEQKKKHVIFLGAGASANSGYPMANGLRLLMSSEKRLRAELNRLGYKNTEHVDKVVNVMLHGPNKRMLELFRHGCYGTVDEFSSLGQMRFQKEVQQLKKLLRFALSLHNPEENAEPPDYYTFIQKLFLGNIYPLRTDIAILTFNYDPYLPYLLERAYGIRRETSGFIGPGDAESVLTSGFGGRIFGTLDDGNGLCLLTLHGATAWPDKRTGAPDLCYADLFSSTIQQRVEQLCFSDSGKTMPPILFPWEILDYTSGDFLGKGEFCLREFPDEDGYRQGNYNGSADLHDLFKAIWRRARREVTAATKISFVGLSMHEFLKPAFKYLFADKQNSAEVLVANQDTKRYQGQSTKDQASLADTKTEYLLKEILLDRIGSTIAVKARESFRDFIKYEMD